MYLLSWTLRFGVLGAHFVAALPPGSTLSSINLLDRDEVAQAELSASLISATSSEILPVPFGTPASDLSNRSPVEEVQELEARKNPPLKVSSTKKTATKPAVGSVKATSRGPQATSKAVPSKASSAKTSIAATSTARRSNATPTRSTRATSTSHQGTLSKSSSTHASSSVKPYPGQISPPPAIAKAHIASHIKPILVKSIDSVTASPITIKLKTPTQMSPKGPLPTPSKGPSFADALDDSLTAKQKADTVKVNKTEVISLAKRSPLGIAKRSGDEYILSWNAWKQVLAIVDYQLTRDPRITYPIIIHCFGSISALQITSPAHETRNEASIGRNEKTADLDYFVQDRTPEVVVQALENAIQTVRNGNPTRLARDYMNTQVGWWISQQDRRWIGSQSSETLWRGTKLWIQHGHFGIQLAAKMEKLRILMDEGKEYEVTRRHIQHAAVFLVKAAAKLGRPVRYNDLQVWNRQSGSRHRLPRTDINYTARLLQQQVRPGYMGFDPQVIQMAEDGDSD